mgnify:CR=1 FL=1
MIDVANKHFKREDRKHIVSLQSLSIYLRLLIDAAISKLPLSWGMLLTISIKAVIDGVSEFFGMILTSMAKPMSYELSAIKDTPAPLSDVQCPVFVSFESANL